MITLNYPFSKVLSPQPLLHRMGSRKKTDGLAEHDLVLLLLKCLLLKVARKA